MKVYQVYATQIRDAQIFTGFGSDNDDASWKDFQQEPLIDIVMAESEDAACDIVAKDNDISPDVLYAIEQIADIRAELDGKTMRTEATAYSTSDAVGIEILLTDGRIAKVETDKSGTISVYVTEPESDIVVRACCLH